ncbi:probable LRR receptor-like serine/threonine-protein kinase At3g47570 isoform X1 [Hevea brasiliensis]|nr:probable LRR receptor-like serine/threonine-protein kinase At3g47570 isoform X1 [Hevea brasiliensis]
MVIGNIEEVAMAINTWWSLYHIPLLCWCLCSLLNPATCLQNETDRLALISFKDAIQKDPFGVLDSWNDSLPFCDWHGVSCGRRHPHRVVTLILNSQGLVGFLSPHIGNLSFLRRIDFRNNSFHGKIPQQIDRLHRLQDIDFSNNSLQGNIPTNLSRCSNLLYLNFIDNKLVGNIPAELGSLPKLEALGLAKNNLTGSIPASMGNLSSLWQISFRRNGLQGQIPEEISQLGSLRILIFGENNLIGEIPYGLFNISNLEDVEVDTNQLNGIIPSDIGLNLPKLSSLQISDNRLIGPIPISLSNASALQQIAFEYNDFSGSIPKVFGMLPELEILNFALNQLQDDLSFIDYLTNCSNLITLGLRGNFLRGTVPISMANLSKDIDFLSVADNQLYGAIPIGVENLVNLRFFLFGDNYLTGPLDIDFGKFPRLELLDLGSNKFTGKIPSSIGNLSFLTRLYLGFNDLHGSIPPSLGSCHNLNELELLHKNLSGSIPTQVMGLSSLSVTLDLSGNALTGPVPLEVGLLTNLQRLDLSDNRLSGTIPNTIGKCLSLQSLNLHGNSFQGETLQDFGALRGLQELDISRNNFSGRIPDSFSQLTGLNHLNLSFNQLQGEVPKRGIFLNASAVSLMGNNDLCGGIAEMKLPSCFITNSKKNNLSLTLKVTIPVVVSAVFSFLLVCSLIFWHWKRISRKKNISMPLCEHQFLRISYAELFKATNGFSMANIIGVGSYGSVYKGLLDQVGIQVAVKVLNLQRRGASNSFMSECQALRTIRHRNLLKLLSVCSSIDFEGNDFKALIYEFMVNGSLEKWLHGRNVGEDGPEGESGNLKLIDRLNIAIDIATAIEYLHNGSSSSIIHGDLKPSNVLLDEEMTAHIGDFGLAKIVASVSGEIQQYQSSSTAIKGSIGYVAPEYGLGDPVSKEGDIYSYAILLLEMFTGKKPIDEYFKDDLNIHTFVESNLPDRVMEILDPRIAFEDGGGSLKDCILSVMRIGVACSMEQPGERMKMRDVISELVKIKSSYVKERQKQGRRNAF